jgi:hypothetical protein
VAVLIEVLYDNDLVHLMKQENVLFSPTATPNPRLTRLGPQRSLDRIRQAADWRASVSWGWLSAGLRQDPGSWLWM